MKILSLWQSTVKISQEVEKQTLSDEKITEEHQPASAISEMLKVWESVASHVKTITLIKQRLNVQQNYTMIMLCLIFNKF